MRLGTPIPGVNARSLIWEEGRWLAGTIEPGAAGSILTATSAFAPPMSYLLDESSPVAMLRATGDDSLAHAVLTPEQVWLGEIGAEGLELEPVPLAAIRRPLEIGILSTVIGVWLFLLLLTLTTIRRINRLGRGVTG